MLKTVAKLKNFSFPSGRASVSATISAKGKSIDQICQDFSQKQLKGTIYAGDDDPAQKMITDRFAVMGPFDTKNVSYNAVKSEFTVNLNFERGDVSADRLLEEMANSDVFLEVETVGDKPEKGKVAKQPLEGQQDLPMGDDEPEKPKKKVNTEKNKASGAKGKKKKKAVKKVGDMTPAEFADEKTHYSMQSIDNIGMPPARNRVIKEHFGISKVMELIDFMEGKSHHYEQEGIVTVYDHPGITKGIADGALDKLNAFIVENGGDPIEALTGE